MTKVALITAAVLPCKSVNSKNILQRGLLLNGY